MTSRDDIRPLLAQLPLRLTSAAVSPSKNSLGPIHFRPHGSRLATREGFLRASDLATVLSRRESHGEPAEQAEALQSHRPSVSALAMAPCPDRSTDRAGGGRTR